MRHGVGSYRRKTILIQVVLKTVVLRSLKRKKEKTEDDYYFTSKRSSGPRDFSRESLQFFEAMDEGQ